MRVILNVFCASKTVLFMSCLVYSFSVVSIVLNLFYSFIVWGFIRVFVFVFVVLCFLLVLNGFVGGTEL